VFVNIPMDL